MEEQNQQAPVQVAERPTHLLGAKELLKNSWQIYKKRFSTFMLISLVSLVTLPLYFVNPTAFLVIFPLVILWALIAIFLGLWQMPAMLYAVKDRDQNIGFKESFKRGLSKIWPYLGTEALAGLAVLGGTILLVIPGIIFAIWFTFSSYLVVSENLSGKAALSRSKQLVKGSFWAVLGRSAFIGLIVFIASLIFGFIFSFVFGEGMENVGTLISSILISPLATIYIFLIYEELKKIKG